MLNFRRKPKEPTTEDISDNIAPWEMLEDIGIADMTALLHERFPALSLTAFARHRDTGVLACFDKGMDGTGKKVVLVDTAKPPDKALVKYYSGFGPWFDAALAEREEHP